MRSLRQKQWVIFFCVVFFSNNIIKAVFHWKFLCLQVENTPFFFNLIGQLIIIDFYADSFCPRVFLLFLITPNGSRRIKIVISFLFIVYLIVSLFTFIKLAIVSIRKPHIIICFLLYMCVSLCFYIGVSGLFWWWELWILSCLWLVLLCPF